MVLAPGTWRWSDCRDYTVMVRATHIHLMCVFTRGHPKSLHMRSWRLAGTELWMGLEVVRRPAYGLIGE
jgi:hypothetical protein